MFKEKRRTLIFYLLIILNYSCNTKQTHNIDVKFNRFDKSTFSLNIDSLYRKYPKFTPFYLQEIIKVESPIDSVTEDYFNQFKTTYESNVYKDVKKTFSSMGNIENSLNKGLQNYTEIFKNDSIPIFYTHFSGFNEPIIRYENIISVSLENYLGDSPYYDELGIYKYLRKGMYPDNIPVDILKLMLLQKINPNKASDNLLSAMIYNGKLYYILHQILPRLDIYDLLNQTKEQKKWILANESNMWSYLVENKHLFSSDYKIIRTYIDPSPFTKNFPNESPGQTGVWIGYRIVDSYMKNTNTNIINLLANSDYQNILKLAEYNPN